MGTTCPVYGLGLPGPAGLCDMGQGGTHSAVDLAAAHDVVQEGVDPVELPERGVGRAVQDPPPWMPPPCLYLPFPPWLLALLKVPRPLVGLWGTEGSTQPTVGPSLTFRSARTTTPEFLQLRFFCWYLGFTQSHWAWDGAGGDNTQWQHPAASPGAPEVRAPQ